MEQPGAATGQITAEAADSSTATAQISGSSGGWRDGGGGGGGGPDDCARCPAATLSPWTLRLSPPPAEREFWVLWTGRYASTDRFALVLGTANL
jgi:hypothetical protein